MKRLQNNPGQELKHFNPNLPQVTFLLIIQETDGIHWTVQWQKPFLTKKKQKTVSLLP